MAQIPPGAQPTPLGDGMMFVHVATGKPGEGFQVFVENKDAGSRLEVTLNFGNSTNLSIKGQRALQMKKLVQPNSVDAFCQLVPKYKSRGTKLVTSIKGANKSIVVRLTSAWQATAKARPKVVRKYED